MKKLLVLVLLLTLVAVGCTTPGKRTAIGAGTGAAIGGIAGAVIGHQKGETGKGAAIGAAAGAILGGGVGNYLDKQAKELEQLAETKRTENGIITTMKGNLLFDSGKADLKPAAIDSVNQISDIIKKYPEDKVLVIGYTDDVGPSDVNQRLSEQRAQAVRLAMIARGIPSASIEPVGMGEAGPTAPNTTAEGRAKNRRVELQITIDESKMK
jgi:outer membrane protein OmpA-like peptidoglycan-associated protein